ncbi:MAG: hypothetical protein U0R64_11490 [Candidatus Nanopelagicales bacterium]
MTRRILIALAALGLVVAGGFAAYTYMFSATTTYANYSAPTFDESATDEQRIFALQTDLGNAAAEMAQLQAMANKLQFGKMKALGRHLQEVADELEPRLAQIEDRQARRLLGEGIEGLRMVGEGSEDLDRDKSLRGVDQVLGSFEALNSR